MFSLGALLYFMWARAPPVFKKHSPVQMKGSIWGSVSTDAQDLLMWMLAPQQQERCEMIHVLENKWVARQSATSEPTCEDRDCSDNKILVHVDNVAVAEENETGEHVS